jgi:hypothetical protein
MKAIASRVSSGLGLQNEHVIGDALLPLDYNPRTTLSSCLTRNARTAPLSTLKRHLMNFLDLLERSPSRLAFPSSLMFSSSYATNHPTDVHLLFRPSIHP